MLIFLSVSISIFILLLFIHSSSINFKFSRLKKEIKNNPLLGEKQEDNNYYYKKAGFTVSYKIEESSDGIKRVKWIFFRRRLIFPEEKLVNIKKIFSKFFIYQGWPVLFRPPILFLLLGSIIVSYFGFVQTQKMQVEGFKWIIATAAGIRPSQVQYIGEGRFQVSGQRKTAPDGINEPIRYTLNPFRSFFFHDDGAVTRWRGKYFGYVTHPVAFNNRGDVWIKKEGTWRHGRLTEDKTVEWDAPQGTRKVNGHTISTQNKKLYIPDK